MSVLTAFFPVIVAAVLGGASAGAAGVYVIGMRMPFITIASAHAALAGAVAGHLLGVNTVVTGFCGALIGAIILASVTRNHNLDPNAALGTIFSLMLGLAFLGIGLSPGPKTTALGFMWGNLLFVTVDQLWLMAAVFAGLIVFIVLFNKSLKLLLFSRQIAAVHISSGTIFLLLLVLEASVITINLQIVGGLLLYSLICNPAIAALKVARSYKSALIISSLLGIVSALGGFGISYVLNWPVGACIVLFSSLLVFIIMSIKKIQTTRRRYG